LYRRAPFDALNLDEVVAAADAADLAVARQTVGRAHEVVQADDALGLETPAAVHTVQVPFEVQLVNEGPQALGQRFRRGIQQPDQTIPEQRLALRP
jgi:hypothetical protein